MSSFKIYCPLLCGTKIINLFEHLKICNNIKLLGKYYLQCPYNKEHIINKKYYDCHVENCPNKIEEKKENKFENNNENNLIIIKPINFLVTYEKKIYKRGNDIIEELEKNEYIFKETLSEKENKEIKNEKIKKENEMNEKEKIENNDENDENIDWEEEEEFPDDNNLEEENSENEKTILHHLLNELKTDNNISENNFILDKNSYNKKSNLKLKNENKNDSFKSEETNENSLFINNTPKKIKKNVNFTKFINVYIFEKDENKKEENQKPFKKTYIKSL